MPEQPLSREERLQKARQRQEPSILAKSLQFTFGSKVDQALTTATFAEDAGLGLTLSGGAKDKIAPTTKGLKSATPEIKSAFSETFKTANQSIQSLIKNIKESEDVLQGLGNSIDDIGGKFSDLGKSYRDLTVSGVNKFQNTKSAELNKGKITKPNNQTRTVNLKEEAAKGLSSTSDDIKKLNESLGKTESRLTKVGRKLNTIGDIANKTQWFTLAIKSANELVAVTKEIQRNFENIEDTKDVAKLSGVKGTEQLTSLNEQFGSEGKALKTIGSSFVGGQGLTRTAKQGVAVFNRFTQSKTRLNNVLGQNKDLESFVSGIRNLVNGELQNAVTSTQALRGAYEVLSSGFQEAGKATQVLEAGLKLSTASGAKADTVLRTLGKTINAYGFEAEDASKVAGILNRTVQQGITTIPELSSGFGQAATAAKAANVEIEKLGGSVAQLTSQGTGTAQAFTGLKGLFEGISSGKTTERLEKLGITNKEGEQVTFSKEDVEEKGFPKALQEIKRNTTDEQFSKVFRRRRSREAARQLTAQEGEPLKERTASIKGFSDKASEKVTQTATENLEQAFNFKINNDEVLKFQRTVNQSTEALLNLGKAVRPAFEGGVEALSQMASSIENVTSKFPGLLKSATKAALGFKAVGSSVKALVETAAKITVATSVVRIFTGAIFKQVSALGNAQKGLRRYNVIAADVVKINGKLANSFQRIGLVASQLTGFGAAQNINYSGGETRRTNNFRSFPYKSQTPSISDPNNTSRQLRESFYQGGRRQTPSISSPTYTTPVVAEATGRRNLFQRINNNLVNRTVTGKWNQSSRVGNVISGLAPTVAGTAGSVSGNSQGRVARLRQGISNQVNRLGSAANSSRKAFQRLLSGILSFGKAIAPISIAIGALVTAFKGIQGVAAFFNAPRKATKSLKDDIKELNKELNKIDGKNYEISLESVGLKKGKNSEQDTNFADRDKSFLGNVSSFFQGISNNLQTAWNVQDTAAAIGRESRGVTNNEQKTRTELAEKSLESRKDFIRTRKEVEEAPTLEKTIEAQQNAVPQLKKNIENQKSFRDALQNRVKEQKQRVEENDTKNPRVAANLESDLYDAQQKLSEVKNNLNNSEEEYEQLKENRNLNYSFQDRLGTASENTKLSASLESAFEKRRKKLFDNTESVVKIGSEDREEGNLEKIDKNYQKAVETLNKQRQRGNITNEEFQNEINNLRNKSFETKGGEKVKVSDLITDPNLIDQTLKAIVNSVEKRIKEAQNFAKNNKIGIKFETQGDLISDVGVKQRRNQIDQDVTNTKLETLKNKKLELKDEGRLEENPQLRKNLNQQIENARTRQDTLNIEAKQLPIQRERSLLQLKQQDISTSSNSNSRQIRDLKQDENQIGIEGQKNYIQRLQQRKNELISNDASNERINTIDNRINVAQNELERKQVTRRQLNSTDERETLNERIDTQLTETRNIAESKTIPLENEEQRNQLQQKVLNESSNTIGKAENQISTLEGLLSQLDIGGQRKEDLKEESLEAKSKLGDERIKIQEKILSLEQKRLKIIQKQAEIQAKVKTQEAKANVLKEEVEYQAVKDNPNATDAERKAAAAELQAARTGYQGAKQNEKLVDQQGKVQQAINNAKQGKLELDKFIKGIRDQVQKALNTDVASDDIKVFKDSLSGFNEIAQKATSVVSNLGKQLANIAGIDNSNRRNNKNFAQDVSSNNSSNNSSENAATNISSSNNENNIRNLSSNNNSGSDSKSKNFNNNLWEERNQNRNNLTNAQEKKLAEALPNVSREEVKRSDVMDGSSISVQRTKSENINNLHSQNASSQIPNLSKEDTKLWAKSQKQNVKNKRQISTSNSDSVDVEQNSNKLWEHKNSQNDDLTNTQEKKLAKALPNVSRKEARRADVMNGSALQIQKTKNPQSIYDSGQTKNITSSIPNLTEQDVKLHRGENNKKQQFSKNQNKNESDDELNIPELEFSNEEKSNIRRNVSQLGNPKLQQSVDRVAKTKEQARKFRENDKSFLDKSGKSDMFYNAKQERYKTINNDPNKQVSFTEQYHKRIKERNKNIGAVSQEQKQQSSEGQKSIIDLQKAVNSFDTSSMIKEIEKLRAKINQADQEKGKESAEKATSLNENSSNNSDKNQKNSVSSKNVEIGDINVSVEVSTPTNEEGGAEEIGDKIEEVLNQRFSNIAQNLEQELGVN